MADVDSNRDACAAALCWIEQDECARFIATPEMAVLWMNDAAAALIAAGADLVIRKGQIVATCAENQTRLTRLFAESQQEMRQSVLKSETGKGHLLLQSRKIAKYEHQPAIGIAARYSLDRPGHDFHDLEHSFGITKAENRLLLELLSGKTAEQASQKLGVSIETTRSHIRHVYLKLNVSSREEMFSRLMPYRMN